MPYASGKKRIDYQRDLRNKRAAKGLCTRCGEKVKGIRLDCERCLRNANRLVQVIVKRNLKKGRCRCGRKRVSLKKVCQRCRDNSRDILRQLKEQVLAGYGKRCVCCGETIYEFLSIDHKYNDGADDRKRMGAKSKAASLYRTIIAEGFPDRYQILCYNCNMAKGFFGYCPHQKLEEYAIHNSRRIMNDDSLENLTTWSLNLYDSFALVRDFIKEHPETKDVIVSAVAKAMTDSFAANFYEPSHH